ncbi:MAG: xanthine phosphoribosyltransferase [Firmicutes bacterium]|nr:xanthine phosphoribosyltransferase [Bacillota bacterium]
MELLKKRIIEDGSVIGTEIVKVDGFLNHRLDVKLLDEIGKEFASRFSGVKIDKILTVEASGIAVACMTAPHMGHPPVVFAKKATPSTMNEGFYEAEAHSFTKGTISKFKVDRKFLEEGENVLILDDFLASGQASVALVDIIGQAKANVAGIGAVIEKNHQGGRKKLEEMGHRVEALAVIDRIEDGKIIFLQK